MAAGTFVPFVAFFSCLWIFVLPSEDTQELRVKPEQDVVLQCRALAAEDDEDYRILDLKWSRADLEKDIFVFNGLHEKYHPSFHGRVELREPEMKNGDVSVILKNVTINDTGTYECWVRYLYQVACITDGNHHISTIELKVEDSAGATEEGGDEETGNNSGGNKDGGTKDEANKEGNSDGGKDGGDRGRRKADVNSWRHVGLVVGLSLGVLVVVVVVVVVVVLVRFKMCRKYQVLTDNNS